MSLSRWLTPLPGEWTTAAVGIAYLLYEAASLGSSEHAETAGGALALLTSPLFLGYIVVGAWIIRSLSQSEIVVAPSHLTRFGTATRAWARYGLRDAVGEAARLVALIAATASIVTFPTALNAAVTANPANLLLLLVQSVFLCTGLVAIRALLVALRLMASRTWLAVVAGVVLWLLTVTNATLPGLLPDALDLSYAMNYALYGPDISRVLQATVTLGGVLSASFALVAWSDKRRLTRGTITLSRFVQSGWIVLVLVVLVLTVSAAVTSDSFSEFILVMLGGYQSTILSALIEATLTLGFAVIIALNYLKTESANLRQLEVIRSGSLKSWSRRAIVRESRRLVSYCIFVALVVTGAGALFHRDSASTEELARLTVHLCTVVALQIAVYSALVFLTAGIARSRLATTFLLAGFLSIPPPGIVIPWVPLHRATLDTSPTVAPFEPVITLISSLIAIIVIIVIIVSIHDASRRTHPFVRLSPKENTHAIGH